ncbi:MAG TPA: hypothetical protein VN541_18660 [Tepidisphaeraceae bacterium]|nr:hypothetical protein [Tepidisphaeraceae bacterium]
MPTAQTFIPRIRLQPRQGELYNRLKTGPETNFGVGGARGGAKSGGGRRIILLRRFDFPGTVGMIFRRTYPELLDNHILPFWREFPALESGYNKGEKNLTLPNGSIIAFRYGENLAAIESFLGKEFQDILVDQAESLTELERQYLKSCCRWTGVPDNQCKFIETFNPGGRGSGHLKRIYRLRAFTPEEDPRDYAFLPARGWDNIEWVRPYLERSGITEKTYYREWTDPQRKECFLKHSSYGRTMAALPPGLRAGWLEGDFDSFSGQFFENFTEAAHVVDDHEMHWRPWFKRWIAIDWGYHHNAAVGWFTQAYRGDDTARPLYWQYREFVRNKMDSTDLAERIADLSDGEEIDAIYMGSDAKSTRDAGGDTPHNRMSAVFRKRGLPMIADANRDRVSGWRLMHELFGRLPSESDPGEPAQVVVSRSCQRTASTITLMSVDKAKPEDCEKFDSNEEGDGGDDAADMFRYGLLSRLKPGKKPIEIELGETLASITDMTEKSMAHRRLMDRARKKLRTFRLR